MFKKVLLLFSLFAFVATVTAPLIDSADAKRSFRSGTKTFTKTPAKSDTSVNSGTTARSSTNTTGTAASSANRGMFGGGSFLKGMMIGGLAGLLFGGLFANMGFMGELLGLMINVLAIVALIAIVRAVFASIRKKRDSERPNYVNPNDRRW
jgi:predicted lipid-binding transport protein (Tim44 family)